MWGVGGGGPDVNKSNLLNTPLENISERPVTQVPGSRIIGNISQIGD